MKYGQETSLRYDPRGASAKRKRRRRRKTEDDYPTWTYKRLGGRWQTKKHGKGHGTVRF